MAQCQDRYMHLELKPHLEFGGVTEETPSDENRHIFFWHIETLNRSEGIKGVYTDDRINEENNFYFTAEFKYYL